MSIKGHETENPLCTLSRLHSKFNVIFQFNLVYQTDENKQDERPCNLSNHQKKKKKALTYSNVMLFIHPFSSVLQKLFDISIIYVWLCIQKQKIKKNTQ